MQLHNLCRSIKKQGYTQWNHITDCPHKFQLPDGGLSLRDDKLTALIGGELKLPFSQIVLEFKDTIPSDKVTKILIFAEIVERMLNFTSLFQMKGDIGWYEIRDCSMDTVEWESKIFIVPALWDAEMMPDLFRMIGLPVLSLLNALACSNVKTEDRKLSKPLKKGALPFDTYKVLTVESKRSSGIFGSAISERHSPREHIRRGHIRVLPTKKIWINNTVVNAGTVGKVHKSYLMR